MTRQDAFPLKDYDLPDGVDRHIDAAPQQDYTSSARYQDELDHVFYQDWVMVGRVGMIPEPGDYFTCHVGEKPVIVMRQQDGTIAAMGNFCLHRYAKLLDGRQLPPDRVPLSPLDLYHRRAVDGHARPQGI